MFKKKFSVFILIACVAMSFGARVVRAQSADLEAAKVRSKVEALGSNTRVEVKLRDTTKLKGHISDTDQDSFAVTGNAGNDTKIFYADVVDVKKSGGGWSTKNWIILGSVVTGVLVTWAVVKPALCDGGAQTRGPC